MINLLGISGSLRQGSFNTALLRAAKAALPVEAGLDVRTLHGIPIYDWDLEERDGIPPIVTALKAAIVAADGLLLATPEYNNGIPGVFKNGIDWLSRPASDIQRVFRGKPVALIGASPGGFGTLLAQSAWLPVLRTLGTSPWFGGRMMLSHAPSVLNESGAIKDPAIQEQLSHFLRGFVDFVKRTLKPVA
jgi:chromate reductase, NAD(P)H dehydrogenase (quinone)